MKISLNLKKWLGVIFLVAQTYFSEMAPAIAFEGKCLFEFHHKKYIDSLCNVEIEKSGTFTLGIDDSRLRYFVYVLVDDKGKANGYWNGETMETHAGDPLGKLVRKGACWINKNAKVCAWRKQ